ncbi:vacuolar sorting protein 39 [Pseudoscourfieldia marina]
MSRETAAASLGSQRRSYALRALATIPSLASALALDGGTGVLYVGCRDGALIQFDLLRGANEGDNGTGGASASASASGVVSARVSGRAQLGRRPVSCIAQLPAARRVAALCDGVVSIHPARLWGDDVGAGGDDAPSANGAEYETVTLRLPCGLPVHLIRADGDVAMVPYGTEPCYPPRLLVCMKKKLAVVEVKSPAKAHVLCELDIPTSARDAVWLDRQRVLIGTKRSYSVLDVGAVLRGLSTARNAGTGTAVPTLSVSVPCDAPNGLSAYTAAGFVVSRGDSTPVPLLVDVVEMPEGTFVPLCSKVPASVGSDGSPTAANVAASGEGGVDAMPEAHALFVCTKAGVAYDAVRLRPSSVGALAFPTPPQRMACAGRGAPYVLSVGGDGVVHVLDLNTGARVQSMVLENYPESRSTPRSLTQRLSIGSMSEAARVSEGLGPLKTEVHLAASGTLGTANAPWIGAVAITCETAVSLLIPVAPAAVVGELLREGRLEEALEAAASEARALANAPASMRGAAVALLDAARAEAGFLYIVRGQYEKGFRSLANASCVRPGEVFPLVPSESRRFGALAKPQRRLGICLPPVPLDKLVATTAAEARRMAASPVGPGSAPSENALLRDARGWLAWFLLECRRHTDLSDEEHEAVDTVASRVLTDLTRQSGGGAAVHRSRLEVLCADPSNRVNLLDAGQALTSCGCHVALAVLHESHGVFNEALRIWWHLHSGKIVEGVASSSSGNAAVSESARVDYALRGCRAVADAACPAAVAQEAVTSWLLAAAPSAAIGALAAPRVGGAISVALATELLEPHGEPMVAAYLSLVTASAAAHDRGVASAVDGSGGGGGGGDGGGGAGGAVGASPDTLDVDRFVLACARLAWPSSLALGGRPAHVLAAAAGRLLEEAERQHRQRQEVRSSPSTAESAAVLSSSASTAADEEIKQDDGAGAQLAWARRLLRLLRRSGEYAHAPHPDAERASSTLAERMRKWAAGSSASEQLDDAWRRCVSAACHLEGRFADAARELLHLHGIPAPGAGGVSLSALEAAEDYAASLGDGPGAEPALLALFDELLRRGGHSAAARLAASGLGGCDPVRVLQAAPGLAPLAALPAIAEPLFRAAEAARRRGAIKKSLARAASTRRRGELADARGGRVVLREGTCCALCHKVLNASTVFGLLDGAVVCWNCTT